MSRNGGAVKLLLTYDPDPTRQDEYYQFVLGEFVPGLQELGLPMSEVWHTAYGDYPLRLIAFVAEDRATLRHILATPTFRDYERRLLQFVTNYDRRVVALTDRFQF